MNDVGRGWLEELCPEDADHTYVGDALVVEHRFAADLAEGDGLVVS